MNPKLLTRLAVLFLIPRLVVDQSFCAALSPHYSGAGKDLSWSSGIYQSQALAPRLFSGPEIFRPTDSIPKHPEIKCIVLKGAALLLMAAVPALSQRDSGALEKNVSIVLRQHDESGFLRIIETKEGPKAVVAYFEDNQSEDARTREMWVSHFLKNVNEDTDGIHETSLKLFHMTDREFAGELLQGLLRRALSKIQRDSSVDPIEYAHEFYNQLHRDLEDLAGKPKTKTIADQIKIVSQLPKDARQTTFLEALLDDEEPLPESGHHTLTTQTIPTVTVVTPTPTPALSNPLKASKPKQEPTTHWAVTWLLRPFEVLMGIGVALFLLYLIAFSRPPSRRSRRGVLSLDFLFPRRNKNDGDQGNNKTPGALRLNARSGDKLKELADELLADDTILKQWSTSDESAAPHAIAPGMWHGRWYAWGMQGHSLRRVVAWIIRLVIVPVVEAVVFSSRPNAVSHFMRAYRKVFLPGRSEAVPLDRLPSHIRAEFIDMTKVFIFPLEWAWHLSGLFRVFFPVVYLTGLLLSILLHHLYHWPGFAHQLHTPLAIGNDGPIDPAGDSEGLSSGISDPRHDFRIAYYRARDSGNYKTSIQIALDHLWVADIPSIWDQGRQTIDHEDQFEAIVDPPLVEACKILFRAGVITQMTSANLKNVQQGHAFITIDPSSLSDAQRQVAEDLVKKGLMDRNFSQLCRLEIPLSPNTTVLQLHNEACAIAEKFKATANINSPVAPHAEVLLANLPTAQAATGRTIVPLPKMRQRKSEKRMVPESLVTQAERALRAVKAQIMRLESSPENLTFMKDRKLELAVHSSPDQAYAEAIRSRTTFPEKHQAHQLADELLRVGRQDLAVQILSHLATEPPIREIDFSLFIQKLAKHASGLAAADLLEQRTPWDLKNEIDRHMRVESLCAIAMAYHRIGNGSLCETRLRTAMETARGIQREWWRKAASFLEIARRLREAGVPPSLQLDRSQLLRELWDDAQKELDKGGPGVSDVEWMAWGLFMETAAGGDIGNAAARLHDMAKKLSVLSFKTQKQNEQAWATAILIGYAEHGNIVGIDKRPLMSGDAIEDLVTRLIKSGHADIALSVMQSAKPKEVDELLKYGGLFRIFQGFDDAGLNGVVHAALPAVIHYFEDRRYVWRGPRPLQPVLELSDRYPELIPLLVRNALAWGESDDFARGHNLDTFYAWQDFLQSVLSNLNAGETDLGGPARNVPQAKPAAPSGTPDSNEELSPRNVRFRASRDNADLAVRRTIKLSTKARIRDRTGGHNVGADDEASLKDPLWDLFAHGALVHETILTSIERKFLSNVCDGAFTKKLLQREGFTAEEIDQLAQAILSKYFENNPSREVRPLRPYELGLIHLGRSAWKILTGRQRQIILLCQRGMSRNEIAVNLKLALSTVKNQIKFAADRMLPTPLSAVTLIEQEFVGLLVQEGYKHRDIETKSGISKKYAKSKLQVIFNKLGLGGPEARLKLARIYVEQFGPLVQVTPALLEVWASFPELHVRMAEQVAQGELNKKIGASLGLSDKKVRNILTTCIFAPLGITGSGSRLKLAHIVWAIQRAA